MFMIHAITGKSRRIDTKESLEKFLAKYENKSEQLILLNKHLMRGDTVYYAENPFTAEIENLCEIIVGKSKDDVAETYYRLSEET